MPNSPRRCQADSNPTEPNTTWSLWGGSNGATDDDDYTAESDCGLLARGLNVWLAWGMLSLHFSPVTDSITCLLASTG